MSRDEKIKFTITCEMTRRWLPHFLAMLKYMMFLGNIGSSRMVSFYSDGDGDFRPKFSWDPLLPSDAKPVKEKNGEHTYDAG